MNRLSVPILVFLLAKTVFLFALYLHLHDLKRLGAQADALALASEQRLQLDRLQQSVRDLQRWAASPSPRDPRTYAQVREALEAALESAAGHPEAVLLLPRLRRWADVAAVTQAEADVAGSAAESAALLDKLDGQIRAGNARLQPLLDQQRASPRPWIKSDDLGLLASVVVFTVLFAFVLLDVYRSRESARRADETLQSLQSLMSAAPLAFLAWNRERGVILWSDAAERMFGLRRDDVLGRPLPEELSPLAALQDRVLASAESLIGIPVDLRDVDDNPLPSAVSLSRLSSRDGGERTYAAVIEDITPRRLQEVRRLDAVRTQRDALVREVHHRIKNHLQGVAGLLRQHLSGKPLLQPLLEAASSQILTIAAVHGLQGELQGELQGGRLSLRALVTRIASSISGIMQVPIVLADSCVALDHVELVEEEMVPVAMVLNELLMNAVKHRTQIGVEGLVQVGAERDDENIAVLVRNRGFLPSRFNLALGVNIGTGLGLVKSLLPQRGAELAIAEESESVVARLSLSPPHVLRTDQPPPSTHELSS